MKNEVEGTYCNPSNPVCSPHSAETHSGITGNAIDEPTNNNCRAVLTLDIMVGFTSADGSEKSQYLLMVFGGGREIHR